MKAKVSVCTALLLLACLPAATAQADGDLGGNWEHSPEVNMYFLSDGFYAIPIYAANHDWLHLEGRFNYEDVNTLSAWAGYNISGGKKFLYAVTPMAGVVIGNINGLAPGLEFSLQYGDFELYSESEYVFDLQQKENDFYYNWSDLTYAPLDWLWLGVSGQRTRVFETALDVQRGLLIGGGFKWFEISGYIYNIGWDDPYVILSLSLNIPAQ